VEVAKWYIQDGNEVGVEAAVKEIISRFSHHPLLSKELLTLADNLSTAKGHFSQIAGELYEYISSKFPRSEEDMLSQAGLISLAVLDGRIADAQTAVEGLPNDGNPALQLALYRISTAFYNKGFGLFYAQGGSKDEAKRLLMNAAEICNGILDMNARSEAAAMACFCLGYIHGSLLEDYEKGLEYWQHYVQSWPQSKDASYAQYQIAKLCRYRAVPKNEQVVLEEEYTIIERAYRQVLERYPDSDAAAWALLDLARENSWKWGRWWRRAAQYYEEYLVRFPKHWFRPFAMINLAECYLNMGDRDQAKVLLMEVVQIPNPEDERQTAACQKARKMLESLSIAR